jgi:hypothetical protein
MNDVQQRAAAAGFLHALRTTPALYDEWKAMNKSDAPSIGQLVQKTLGLVQTPTKDDLQAMATHIDRHLREQVAEIQTADASSPRHVGFILIMQQG